MMKPFLIAALLVLPGAAFAQTAPAPAASPAAAAGKLTLDTPIQDIVADAQGKAVIDKHLPGLIGLPQYDMIKGLSLKQLQPYSDGKLTDEILAKTAADLASIK